MANLSLSQWNVDDVKDLCGQIKGYMDSNPSIATHLERELFCDILRYVSKYSLDVNCKNMATEALATLGFAFKRQM